MNSLRVPFPPPLLFFIVLVVGLGLDQVRPWPLLADQGFLRLALGGCFFLRVGRWL